jgi:hypothetical protein
MIINRIYETQNLLSLSLVSFLVGLKTYQRPCTGISCEFGGMLKCLFKGSSIE